MESGQSEGQSPLGAGTILGLVPGGRNLLAPFLGIDQKPPRGAIARPRGQAAAGSHSWGRTPRQCHHGAIGFLNSMESEAELAAERIQEGPP